MKTLIRIFFPQHDYRPGELFTHRYRHVGYSHLGVSSCWKPTVQKCVIEIEKLMWPRWMPFWLKRLIHYLATGNSVVRVKYWWAHNLRRWITKGAMITDIKDKYATLRIYGYFSEPMHKLVEDAEKECSKICEECGSRDDVKITDTGWVYNLCAKCRSNLKIKK